jgi:hypothetical protein
LRLALSKGPNRAGVSLHLRMETDPVSEMSCFSSNYLESGRRTKSENPVILCRVITSEWIGPLISNIFKVTSVIISPFFHSTADTSMIKQGFIYILY